ncbi:hypothetical protein Lal_00048407 [Lupinus albus]|uniref:Uncharacterized protein n=1 Tax=Lupinus albus TaxID=3870 RepID=A0A6A4QM95_LUPAL|nr:hypothetical protein Lalb_Chr04g0251301 [Lupinus albus]KAF1869126.1 hypothetical protein Lal_00048407 [Lupinus albus]
MARPLVLTSLIHNLQLTSMPLFFVVLAMLLSLFSVISFLCGTRNMKEYKTSETEETSTGSKETKLISKLNRNLSSKALSMVKMVSWRKVKPEADDDEEDYGDPDEEVLWRKNILMGERCRPNDLSEKILYNSEGNVIPDLSNQNDKYQH